VALLVAQRSRIPAPTAAVWEVVADPFRRPEWLAGVAGVRGEPLPPAQGPGLAEQRFTVEGRLGPLRFVAREKVKAVWPGTMIAFRGDLGPASYLWTLTLSELDGEQTSLAWNMEVRPAHEAPSLPTRFFLLLFRWIADRRARRSLANLRARLGRAGDQG
jgi:hypothetical protein